MDAGRAEIVAFRQIIVELHKRLRNSPNDAVALCELGGTLIGQGDIERGLRLITQSVVVEKENPHLHCQHGYVLLELGRVFESACAFRQALALDPLIARAYNGLGQALTRQRENELAVACFRKAVKLAPRSSQFVTDLAFGYCEVGEYQRGLITAKSALALDPTYVPGYLQTATALFGMGTPEQAIAPLRKVISLAPNSPHGFHNLGRALYAMNQTVSAAENFKRAISLNPYHADAHFGLAECLLIAGDLNAGFKEYEWRFKTQSAAKSGMVRLLDEFREPEWQGESLRNKRLLVHFDQGYGDTIQFIRFIPVLASKGCRIIFVVQPKLRRLLQNIRQVSYFVEPGGQMPQFDYRIALHSIPGVLRTTINTIPRKVPYLSVQTNENKPVKVVGPSKMRVALFWRTKRLNPLDYRSIPMKELAILVDLAEIQFYDIDPNGDWTPDADSLADKFKNVTSLSKNIDDFEDTAEMLSSMDVVLTIDSAVAHLAGALGLNVWLMLPANANWRWLSRDVTSKWCERSPWYPTMRIFRSRSFKSWKAVLKKIRSELIELAKSKRRVARKLRSLQGIRSSDDKAL